jgi:hypothetical protein
MLEGHHKYYLRQLGSVLLQSAGYGIPFLLILMVPVVLARVPGLLDVSAPYGWIKAAVLLVSLFILTLMIASFSTRCVSYGRKLGVIEADVLLRIDQRSPVLYLRPFSFEKSSTRPVVLEIDRAGGPMFGASGGTYSVSSYEETLAKLLNRVGPCIAVADPKSNQTIMGFSRMQLGNCEWQDEVEKLMKRAVLVITCAGNEDGISWEFAKACEVVPRQRLVILIISSTPDEWWDMADDLLQTKLPRIGTYQSDAVCGLLYFDEHGKPHFDSILRTALRRSMSEAFRPVLRQLQADFDAQSTNG